mgnify:CR=1 FL=1
MRLAQHTATHRARVLQLLSKPCDLFLELTKHGILSKRRRTVSGGTTRVTTARHTHSRRDRTFGSSLMRGLFLMFFARLA